MAQIIENESGESEEDRTDDQTLTDLTKAVDPFKEAHRVHESIAKSFRTASAIEALTSPAIKMMGSAQFIGTNSLNMGVIELIDSLQRQQEMFRSPLQDLFDHNQRIQDTLRVQNTAADLANSAIYKNVLAITNHWDIPTLELFRPSWIDQINALNESHSHLFSGLDNLTFGKRFGFDDNPVIQMQESFLRLERSYLNIGIDWESDSDTDEKLAVIESEFTTRNVIRLVQEEEEQLEEEAPNIREFAFITNEQLKERLDSYNTRLLNPYLGAIKAHNDGGIDTVRHYSASARTLLDQLIADLAPKNEVEKWAFQKGMIKNKEEVNRKIKLQFVFRFIQDSGVREVFEADIVAHNKLIQNLSQLTHQLDRKLTPIEREVLHNKVEYHALLLLNIHNYR